PIKSAGSDGCNKKEHRKAENRRLMRRDQRRSHNKIGHPTAVRRERTRMEATTSPRPLYEPFRHSYAPHAGSGVFAGVAAAIDCSPLAIFLRFVTPDMIRSLVFYTNAYAKSKRANN
ncbi:hypothetical protein L915_20028, partial [Phytophthora nicotianae]